MYAQIAYKSEDGCTQMIFSLYLTTHPFFWEKCQFFGCNKRFLCHVTLEYILSPACFSAARSWNPVFRPQGRLVIMILPVDCVGEICVFWRQQLQLKNESVLTQVEEEFQQLNPGAARGLIKALHPLLMRTKGALWRSNKKYDERVRQHMT